MVTYQVTRIGQVTTIDTGTPSNREVSIRLQTESGDEVLLRMPGPVASYLREKLEGINLPPKGASPVEHLD